MVAIACAFALSVGLAIRHSRVAGDTPYPAGSGMMGPGQWGPAMMAPGRSAAYPSCAAPALPGTVVDVTLADMRGMMEPGGMMGPGMMSPGGMTGQSRNGNQGAPMGMMGMMRIIINPATVPAGKVSFRVSNAGSLNHELVILSLAKGQYSGQRPIDSDGKVDEAGSLAEASHTCGADKGDENAANTGIAPGASGWTTTNLAPGRYELLCNISGHYWAGMYAELDVSPST
ncbi:sulfocyanin-like copper-binding protein [Mycolicibacterium chlorophenolicum]|uniref:Sulfocyanin (SoxE) n=1 Tax=Mycolicibacterium chlorophenolicum TaxID=37916 RepID=A0A0J6VTT9_9MYCO|nr:sulfocyanin-like copper-binding protein [Mycolicibacterium chlorophenolicum]KMO72893.1 Sulfocyanin (SoxE) [Mycolicibacterium chlorophenolicum]